MVTRGCHSNHSFLFWKQAHEFVILSRGKEEAAWPDLAKLLPIMRADNAVHNNYKISVSFNNVAWL